MYLGVIENASQKKRRAAQDRLQDKILNAFELIEPFTILKAITPMGE
jgi:hypothetical protein